MTKRLPTNPSIENLKKQAKQLVQDHKSGQVDAFTRIKASYPRLADASVHEILEADFSLCNAQLVIAREYGFATWKALLDAVTSLESLTLDDTFVTANPSLDWVKDQVARVAPSDLSVLINGETGTGKALVGRMIHRASSRKDGPFITVNCDAEVSLLIESELFGHEAGAFTGAESVRAGKIETARGGTLFLDEVDKLPGAVQMKLMRLLDEGVFERMGGSEPIPADVRIIAATNQDLQEQASEGAFRQELAFLFRKVQFDLPPLRERKSDIPSLAVHFMKQMASHLNRDVPKLSTEAEQALQAYHWPGNVRELEYWVQRAVATCDEPVIREEDVKF